MFRLETSIKPHLEEIEHECLEADATELDAAGMAFCTVLERRSRMQHVAAEMDAANRVARATRGSSATCRPRP